MQACIGPNLCGLVLSGAGSSLPPAPRSGLSVAGCCCCCSLRIRLSSLKRSTHCFLVFPGTLHAIESHRSDAGRLAGNSLRASSRNFCCSLLHACPPPTPLSASIFPTHLPIAHCRFLARKQGTPGVPAHCARALTSSRAAGLEGADAAEAALSTGGLLVTPGGAWARLTTSSALATA